MEDGDNDDECNLHHARPDFMPDARDIMNKFPRPDTAALTEIRAFRETFGTSLLIVSKVWSMLWEEDVLPEGGRPKHLLWALHFLKVYPLQAPGCAAVGASGSAVNPKTHRKWVWAFIDAITELVDEVVSLTHSVVTGAKMTIAKIFWVNLGRAVAAVDGEDDARCGPYGFHFIKSASVGLCICLFFNIQSSPPPLPLPL